VVPNSSKEKRVVGAFAFRSRASIEYQRLPPGRADGRVFEIIKWDAIMAAER